MEFYVFNSATAIWRAKI